MPNCEEWRSVAGFEGAYEVSDLGRVRSVSRVVMRANGAPQTVRGRVLKTPQGTDGYPCIRLGAQGVTRKVHVMVAEAFLGPRPEGLQVCHRDGDRLNPRLQNLRYDTPSANMRDMVRHGRNNTAKVHCPLGHEYVDSNTYYVQAGRGRQCKACTKARARIQKGAPGTLEDISNRIYRMQLAEL